MYKVRFHLGRGDHFMHWQIKGILKGSAPIYVDPAKKSIMLFQCELFNSESTAKRISSGESAKTPCAGVKCHSFIMIEPYELAKSYNEVKYNPRVKPYWRDAEDKNIDGKEVHSIASVGKQLFIVNHV